MAVLEGNWPNTALDEDLATLQAYLQNLILSGSDELVLVRECLISWVLVVWVNESVSDGHTLEVHLKVTLGLEEEVVRDSWDIVTGIALSGDIEIFSLKLWVLLEESNEECRHVLGDLILVGNVMEWVGLGETGSNWLIDVDQVGPIVPGVRVVHESLSISLELVRTVLIEESDFGSTSWSTSEPKNNWIILWITS